MIMIQYISYPQGDIGHRVVDVELLSQLCSTSILALHTING